MPSATATTAARRGLAGVRWVPTIFAMVCIGYGVSAYRRNQIETYLSRTADFEKQDMNRRRRSTVLMDAYGDKSSLEDIERAMAIYESQQGDDDEYKVRRVSLSLDPTGPITVGAGSDNEILHTSIAIPFTIVPEDGGLPQNSRFRKRIRGYVLLVSNDFGFGGIGRSGFRVGALCIFSQVVRRTAKEVSAKSNLNLSRGHFWYRLPPVE
ncbi:hypothetical protein LA080_004467 [Diaporthe eres]|nr:hypothetical protein LA080_004467 [Diaporthe eres]